MSLLDEIRQCNNLHKIPKEIHLNKGVLLDFRLVDALENPDPEIDKVYDFDVYMPTYGINLQRPYVWELVQQREFIMSILLEKPIDPLIIVQDLKDYKNRGSEVNLVIDGKQRLMTIQKFVHNEFSIIINGREVYWKDFDKESRMFFKSRANSLSANVYYSYPDCKVTDEMLIILFNYYNFAGTPQTESHKEKLQSLLEQ
jgi:uncharacterized protein with ParB-like and HNH nuclease domain